METGAIVEYLVEQGDGRLGPPPHRENVQRYRQFLHYAEGSIMPLLFALLIVHRLGLLGRPARKPVMAMLNEHLDWLESELTQRPYFAGDSFTDGSEERRVGKECVSTGRSRWWPDH